MEYSANGYDYKIEEEKDGWFSVYRRNEHTGQYRGVIQAKTLSKAKDYCNLTEPSYNIPKLIED